MSTANPDRAVMFIDVSDSTALYESLGDEQAHAHVRIERRRGRFVLVDHSSNGTSVRISGELEVVLRRDELMLRGSGQIALGQSTGDPDPVLVEFEC